MQDNALIQLFLPIIIDGLSAQNYSGVDVIQAYQPTQQGVQTNPTVYFFKVEDRRYGWVKKNSKWNSDLSLMQHIETQYYETTFRISALVIQNPAVISYTASDLVNSVAAILQSEKAIQTFEAQQVGILRISEIRNPYFVDDKDRFEASPNFDFILTHQQIITTTDQIVTPPIVPGIYPI